MQLEQPESQNEPLKETVNLLDNLITYYQQETMWVYRTRATLENAFDDGPLSDSSTSGSESPEEEDDGEPSLDQSDGRPSPTGSRWIRRKRGFKMRLDFSPKARSTPRSSYPLPSVQPLREQPPPREHLLMMFEKMMETRMESCVRVNKLVRNANRAHLYDR